MASVALMASRQQIVGEKLMAAALALAESLKIKPPQIENVHRVHQRQMRDIYMLEGLQEFLERANRVSRGEPEDLPKEEPKEAATEKEPTDKPEAVESPSIDKMLEEPKKPAEKPAAKPPPPPPSRKPEPRRRDF